MLRLSSSALLPLLLLTAAFGTPVKAKNFQSDSHVRIVRNVEDELRQLSVSDAPPVTENFAATAIPAASNGGGNDEDSIEPNSPSATEFALASTGTPQLLAGNYANISGNQLTTTTVLMSGRSSDDKVQDSVKNDNEEEEITATDEINAIHIGPPSAVFSLTAAATNFTRPDEREEPPVNDVADAGMSTSNVSTVDNDDQLEESEASEPIKAPMKKKATLTAKLNKDQRKSTAAAYEDLMEIVIKVAEHPGDWEEIEQLFEKIEYEDATLKKAKARLRALAMQKQIKLRKGGNSGQPRANSKSKTKAPIPKSVNDVRGKVVHKAMANAIKGSHRFRTAGHIRANEQVPAHQVRITTLTAKQQQQQQQQHDVAGGRNGNHDYAVEQPVTVIGERSRVDPIEKELVEESTSQRLREIQRQKARLFAMAGKSDDMEDQLKTLTKMERRLKNHFRQKQKLMQKIRLKNEWASSDRTPQPRW